MNIESELRGEGTQVTWLSSDELKFARKNIFVKIKITTLGVIKRF